MKTHFQRRYLGIPYALFMMCFVIAPVAVILYYAFTNGEGQFTVWCATRQVDILNIERFLAFAAQYWAAFLCC